MIAIIITMHLSNAGLCLSPSDLSQHLLCPHITTLNRRASEGALKAPSERDPGLVALAERGLRHEAAYLMHLRGQGLAVLEIPSGPIEEAVAQTMVAMHCGVAIIAQAALRMPG